jgi:hypothetical protein
MFPTNIELFFSEHPF